MPVHGIRRAGLPQPAPGHRRTAAQLLGLQHRCRSSRPRRRTRPRPATRSTNSSRWSRPSTRPASRSSSTWSTTTPAKATRTVRRSASAAWTTSSTTCSTAQGKYLNYSGCGNTLKCNHPLVRDLIIESLVYWVAEMHVDGFRFDLASILGRGVNGKVLDRSAAAAAHRRASPAGRHQAAGRGVGRGGPVAGRASSRPGAAGPSSTASSATTSAASSAARPALTAAMATPHLRQPRHLRLVAAIPITRSTSSPATTASRSTTWSATATSTTGPTARTTRTAGTTTSATTAATRARPTMPRSMPCGSGRCATS